MIKRLLSCAVAVMAMAFSANADQLDMLGTCGNGGWGDTSYDAATHTLKYSTGWEGRGWGFGSGSDAFNAAAYDEFVIETEETAMSYNLVIEYAVDGVENSSVNIPAGRKKGMLVLDPAGKAAIKQIYIQASAAGTIVLNAAYFQNAVEVDPTAPVELWSGNKEIDWWGNAVDLTPADFNAAHLAVGDKIEISYTAQEGAAFKIVYVDKNWDNDVVPGMAEEEGFNAEHKIISLPAGTGTYVYTVREIDLPYFTDGALYNTIKFCGDKVTLTKITLVHAAAAAELTNWYISGQFQGWNHAAEGYAFAKTATEGVYEFKTDEIAGEFLIVWADTPGNPNWDKKLGGVTNMEPGTAYTYTEGGNNFSVAGVIQNATIVLDTNAKTIAIKGAGAENEYTVVYLIGDFGEGWREDTTTMPLSLKEGTADTYEGTYKLEAATSYFKMKAGNFVYGTGGDDVAVELNTEYTAAMSGNAFSLAAGHYTFTYVLAKNAETGKLTVKDGAGINDITIDNVPAIYFNLQGARIETPAAGQLVIRCQGAKVEKVLVK